MWEGRAGAVGAIYGIWDGRTRGGRPQTKATQLAGHASTLIAATAPAHPKSTAPSGRARRRPYCG